MRISGPASRSADLSSFSKCGSYGEPDAGGGTLRGGDSDSWGGHGTGDLCAGRILTENGSKSEGRWNTLCDH